MDDETVNISNSDEAKASVSRLLKAIENWATKESQKPEIQLTGFGAALSSQIISFERFSEKDVRQCSGLLGAISKVKQHIDREHKKFDSEIDKMHSRITWNCGNLQKLKYISLEINFTKNSA